MFRIDVYSPNGAFEAFAEFQTKSMCLEWLRGYFYELNPLCNCFDFYSYKITKVG